MLDRVVCNSHSAICIPALCFHIHDRWCSAMKLLTTLIRDSENPTHVEKMVDDFPGVWDYVCCMWIASICRCSTISTFAFSIILRSDTPCTIENHKDDGWSNHTRSKYSYVCRAWLKQARQRMAHSYVELACLLKTVTPRHVANWSHANGRLGSWNQLMKEHKDAEQFVSRWTCLSKREWCLLGSSFVNCDLLSLIVVEVRKSYLINCDTVSLWHLSRVTWIEASEKNVAFINVHASQSRGSCRRRISSHATAFWPWLGVFWRALSHLYHTLSIIFDNAVACIAALRRGLR